MNIVVDDTDPSLTYSGPWVLFAGGSSRQWDSTVHSTTQTGASVSFKFQGSVCKVYGTVPIGNGATVLMDVTIDGAVSPVISRTTGSAASFANLFYQSSNMESTAWHTVVITNRGKAGNVDFQFDRVELDAPDLVPSVASFSPAPPSPTPTPVHTPTPSPTPSSSNARSSSAISLNPTSTITSITDTSSGASSSSHPQTVMSSTSPNISTQVVTTTRDDASQVSPFPDAQVSSGPAHTFPIKIVVGILGGVIALLILILFLILFLRRRKNKNHQALSENKETAVHDMMYQDHTTEATPFTVKPSAYFSDVNASYDSYLRLQPMSEKMLFQQARAGRSENYPTDATSIRSTTFLSTPSPGMAYPLGFSGSDGTGSVSNFEPGTLSYMSESSSIPLTPVAPHGQPEPTQTDVKSEAACLRYLSTSSNTPTASYPGLRYLSRYSGSGPSMMSAYGGTNTESMYDMPPAYRPNR